MPLPQTACTTSVVHCPALQTLPAPQGVPSASTVRAEQVWVAPSQVEGPWQGSAGSQCPSPRETSNGMQLYVQSFSQPALAPFFSPLSHSSTPFRTPSPQKGVVPASGPASMTTPGPQEQRASTMIARSFTPS